MTKYKVTNRLEQPVKYNGVFFLPKETKILGEKPESDKFHTEKVEEFEQPKNKFKGGKK